MTEYGCVGVTQPSSYGTNDKIGSLAHPTGIAYRLNGPPHEQTAVVRTSDRTPVAALRSIGKSSHADSAPQTLLVAHLVQGRWGQRITRGVESVLGAGGTRGESARLQPESGQVLALSAILEGNRGGAERVRSITS